ncbi:Arc/MetJ-type ribon-helix-helix transcriptional regulator [Streptacidiphilus sp. EB129]
MVNGMATTKKYTVTLPEDLAESVRAKVGPGNFSNYVTQAIARQEERGRLHELVDWLEDEYGPVTEEELTEAEAERRLLEQRHTELAATREGAKQQHDAA